MSRLIRLAIGCGAIVAIVALAAPDAAAFGGDWKDGCPAFFPAESVPDYVGGVPANEGVDSFGILPTLDSPLGASRIATEGWLGHLASQQTGTSEQDTIVAGQALLQLSHESGLMGAVRFSGGGVSDGLHDYRYGRTGNIQGFIGFRRVTYLLGPLARLGFALRFGGGGTVAADNEDAEVAERNQMAALSTFRAPLFGFDRPLSLTFETRFELVGCHAPFFDLHPGFKTGLNEIPGKVADKPKNANESLGYYCFEMSKPPVAGLSPAPPKVWAVVLNTNTDAGSYGYISKAQLDWLEEVLKEIPEKELILVFSHHPVWAIYDQKQRLELTKLITEKNNVIGDLAGHTHKVGLRVIRPLRGSPGHAKWEVVAPSVIDYPQSARQITVKSTGQLGYIEVLTFTSSGTGASVPKIIAAGQGAVRDLCVSHSEKCDGGHAILPAREITFPRLFFRMP